jgi:hypothetical protein
VRSTNGAREKGALEERCAWIIGARTIGAIEFRIDPGSLRCGAGLLFGCGFLSKPRIDWTWGRLIDVQAIAATDTLETEGLGQGSPTPRWPGNGFAPGLGRLVKSPDFA